jgi:uncharacterized protein YjaG (DUF416 family)
MGEATEFDKGRLRQLLVRLSKWKQVAFAASCVEILVPSYARFAELEGVGDPALVRAAAEAVWSELGRSLFEGDPPDLPPSSSIRRLVPNEDDWNEWAPQAEDAIAALFYLLEFVQNNNIEFLIYVAQRAYSAIDELTARQLDLGVLDAAQRRALLQSPPIQTELLRQQDAIRLLQDSSDGDESLLSNLRETSKSLAVGERNST